MSGEVQLYVTDGDLAPVGDPIAGWTSIVATPQFNAVGLGTVTVPATPGVLDQVNADRARLVVILDDEYFMGGPIETNTFDWSAGNSSDGSTSTGVVGGGDSDTSEPGLLTFSFADDFARIADENTYPDPAHASTAQADAFYVATAVNAETLLYDLVNLNVGPGAILARRIPQLVMDSPAGLGTNVNLSARFDALADDLRTVAISGGGLGFRTLQVDNQIVFTVYDPTNLATAVYFSRDLNNLRTVSLTISKPTCTVAIVGGDGTGTDRTIVERTNPDAITRWGRVVQFVNQGDTSDTTVMAQAGDQALADGGEQGQVTFTAVDTDLQKYGRDYTLGNVVTCAPYPGLEITAIVRAVTLTASPDTGVVVSPLIGPDSAITDTKTLSVLRGIERRLGSLETSQ